MLPDAGSTWAGTYDFRARQVLRPDNIEAIVEIVAASRHVRALGTRHSFNDLADTELGGDLISLERLPANPVIDIATSTVSVGAATSFALLAARLEANGFALHNLGSLPHISVAGACATGTHGSGNENGSLSTAVAGIELVTGTGDVLHLTRGDPEFEGSVIALGALGIVTRVTLDIQPSYQVRQDVFLDLPWESLLENFDAISGAGYSVSLFTDWLGSAVGQVWVKSRVAGNGTGDANGAADDFFGTRPAGERVMSPTGEGHDNTTVQCGVPGPWSERLPHFRADAVPSNGNEIQTEYFVDKADALDALRAVRALGDVMAGHLMISELRTVAADSLWLSPTRGRDCVALHFTWFNEPDAVRAVLPLIESALAPFDPRPHWGKWFAMAAGQLAPKYRKLGEFYQLAELLDPQRRFRNPYLERTLGLPRNSA